MSDHAVSEPWRLSLIESILHSGTFGILIVIAILLMTAVGIGSVLARRLTVATTVLPLPAILGVMFYSFCIWRTVPEILHSPGVRDPNWYFYLSSDAALIAFLGCVSSVILFVLTMVASIGKRNES